MVQARQTDTRSTDAIKSDRCPWLATFSYGWQGLIISSSATRQWYFGWNVVIGSATLTLLTIGLRMGFGPLFLPITQDLGLSRTALSGIVAIGMLFYGLGMPVTGYLLKRTSPRRVVLLGTLINVLSIWWTVKAGTALSFALAFGVFLSLGLALVSPTTFTPLIMRWFVRQRGAAVFYLSTGGMAGMALVTPLLNWMVERVGWRDSLLYYGGVMALMALIVSATVIREKTLTEAQAGALSAGRSRVTEPARDFRNTLGLPFWKIVLGMVASGLSVNLLAVHGVPMLIDHGFDASHASIGIGLIGVSAIFGTIGLGRLSDRLPRPRLLAAVYLLRAVAFVGFLSVTSVLPLYAVGLLSGIVWAGNIALSSAILADLYGVKRVGVLYGWAYLAHQVAGMLSTWAGGWAYETFHTHWLSFGITAVILAMAAIVATRIPSR